MYRTVVVVQLNATDLDFNGKGPLRYEIVNGDDAGKFHIDSSNGLVTVNNASGLASSYKLKVCIFCCCNAFRIHSLPINLFKIIGRSQLSF